ncbi:MAG: hypothetical protein RIC35_12185 [Marinoscillum sp.]
MIRFVLVFLGVIGFLEVKSQFKTTDPERAMVSYRDGSFFIGHILSRDYPAWAFKLSTGDTIHLNPALIDRLLAESEAIFFRKNKYHTRKGLFANSSLTFHAGWESSVQWDGTLGFALNDRLDIGAGLGISGHDVEMGNDWVYNEFVHVYGYGRYYLNKHFMRLYVDSKLGCGIAVFDFWEDNHNGGLYFQPGLGVLFASKNALKWNIGLSQYLLYTSGQTRSFGFNGNTVDIDYQFWYNRTVLQFGVSLMITEGQLRNFSFF